MKSNSFLFLAAFSVVSGFATGASAQGTPSPISNPAILFGNHNLSPAELFEAGHRITGIYNLYRLSPCSKSSAQTSTPTLYASTTTVQNPGSSITVSADAITQLVLETDLLPIYNLLKTLNDPTIQGHLICVGAYHETTSKIGNASSLVNGFLVLDPRILFFLWNLPEARRHAQSGSQMLIHEFAHQIQYWTEDRFAFEALTHKRSARHPELAADCVASGLHFLRWKDATPAIQAITEKGIVQAAIELGDYEFESSGHHGTPLERRVASEIGINHVKTWIQKNRFTLNPVFSSAELLRQCNQSIQIRDLFQGQNWKNTD